jgi:rhodanese-related sulfurtransferase
MLSTTENKKTSFNLAEISREELQKRLRDNSLQLVDVLPAESYDAGHIPGAISLPLENLEGRASDLLPDRHAEIVVYCGKFTWPKGQQAVALLTQLGYSNVRDYRGGLADWVESGGSLEKTALPPSAKLNGPTFVTAPDGVAGDGPARIADRSGWRDFTSELISHVSTVQLFLIWIVTVMLCGCGYWLASLLGEHGLVEAGSPLGTDLRGLAGSIYFSFVTATSLGYGDIVPIGGARILAVTESVAALLLFGAVVAKFVSHRQDELMLEIHRVTFDDRLDRVQSNLHIVISELLSINASCEAAATPLHRMAARLDSTIVLFLGELRTTRDLLYQPRLLVEEAVLSSILANLSSALDVLAELLTCLPKEFNRSQRFQLSLSTLTRLADDICGTCVPHAYTPRLTFWMDRIQQTSREIHWIR